MGESRRKRQGTLIVCGVDSDPQTVDTLGGRLDAGASATPNGQLVFFAEFLATTAMPTSPRCAGDVVLLRRWA